MALKEVTIPDIGNYKGVAVIEVLVKAGDVIKQEQSLITLETDKATMEIPAPLAGTVKEVAVKVGSKVSQGDLILKVEVTGAEPAPAAQPAPTAAPASGQPASKTDSPAGSQEIKVPDIGNYKGVAVIEVMIKAGDTVKAEQSLIVLETDKATMEIPAPSAGVIKTVKVKVGDKVSQGDLIATVAGGESEAAAPAGPTSQVEAPESAPAQAAATPAQAQSSESVTSAAVHAGPSVRRLAREFGVDLARVKGSGPKNRILKEDVQTYVKGQLNAVQSSAATGGAGLNLLADPVVDFAQFGEVEQQALTRIKKISGANLHRNWVKIPHITLCDETDITDLEAFRNDKKALAEKAGVKLTPVPFLVKAVAAALKAHPTVNSSLSADGENLIVKKYINVGVAVDTPIGLMVPVIRDADKKGIYQIARELAEIAGKAKEGKLKPADMQGGCFTISSLGGIGTTYFTPIVNMPEVGILGVSKAQMKPIWDGKAFQPKLMLPLSLSLDHRVVDGAEGARFLMTLARHLSDIRELLL